MISRRWVLFLASFLLLYFELVLIRWVPGQVRVLAYFTNFVLIACFFGMGLGMVLAKSSRDLGRWAPAGIAGVVILAIVGRQLWILPQVEDALFLEYEESGGPGVKVALLFPVLIVFYLALAAAFVPFGQLIGRSFSPAPGPSTAGNVGEGSSPLLDYAVNLLGSMAGILVFFVYSWLSLPAWAWFLLGMPLLVLLAPADWFARVKALVYAGAVVALVWQVDQGTIWSPYQKIDVTPLGIDRATGKMMPFEHEHGNVEFLPPEVGFNLRVNDDFYQFPVSLADATLAKYARYPALRVMRAQYELPYKLKPNAKRVLIVGGGTGNDAAAALRQGAQHIDVVDIDPDIVALGRRQHPEKPYDNRRVVVHIDDARHFFHHAEPGYDVIVFALLDSHRLLSTLSSLRLDSYVFTVESFDEARRLLAPDGIQLTSFAIGQDWMRSRFYEMLRSVHGSEPVVVNEQGLATHAGIIYLAGPGSERAAQGLGMTVKRRPPDPAAVLATDDWPFVYARGRLLAGEYQVALALVLLLSLIALGMARAALVRETAVRDGAASAGLSRRPDVHFFCLGAGFLLLETKNVTTIALVFGSTWYVNSVVFFSVLVMALLSSLLMAGTDRVKIGWAYAGLFAALALNAWFPLRQFAPASLAVRLLLVGGMTALPVFFSGIIFAHSFKRTDDPASALAANVLGGVLGGVLEYLSIIMGLRFLFLLIAAFYGLSLAALRWRGQHVRSVAHVPTEATTA